MSSDDEISDIDSGDDMIFPTIKDDDDIESDLDSEEVPELEEGDRIDDDALVEDDIDELDIVDDEEEQKELEKVLVSELKDRNHKIVRIIPNDERISSNRIQRPEMTEAIGIRVSQIEQGSPVFTDVKGYTDPILMAKKEFVDRKNPLILERALQESPTEALVEHWLVREMTYPITNREIMMISHEQLVKKTAMKVKTSKTGQGESRDSENLGNFRYL